MAYDAAQLLQMTQSQLDDLFRASPAGPIPNGEAVGTAIIGGMALSTLLNLFFIPVLYVILKTLLAKMSGNKVVKPSRELPGSTTH
mgnify:CR=1 FL=1